MPRMRHAFDPSAERLEAHVLLSSVTGVQAPAGPPITETLTTDKTAYKVGQPVRMTLTETNNTNAAVTLSNIAHVDGFTVTRDFETVWVSGKSGQRAGSSKLQPGQTRTVRVVWNGRPNVGSSSHSAPLTGTFEVDNTVANNSVTIVIDPAHGKGSTAGPTSSVPNETFTLTSG